MRRFKYLIQKFENLTTVCRVVAWWWLIFAIMPGWAGESKPVPPQSNPVSTSCTQIDDKIVEKWKEEVKKFQKSLSTNLATRGGGELDISSPLFLSVFSPQNAKILAGTRKIHIAWEGGQKRYRVKIFPSGRSWVWTLSNLQDAWVSSAEKEFELGNYWVVVTDDNDNESKWKFTVVDLESQPFSKQFNEIQKDTSLNEVQKKWRLATLLVSCGEEWKLEAYQQIAEQKEKDEFYWAWLGIKYGILPKY